MPPPLPSLGRCPCSGPSRSEHLLAAPPGRGMELSSWSALRETQSQAGGQRLCGALAHRGRGGGGGGQPHALWGAAPRPDGVQRPAELSSLFCPRLCLRLQGDHPEVALAGGCCQRGSEQAITCRPPTPRNLCPDFMRHSSTCRRAGCGP